MATRAIQGIHYTKAFFFPSYRLLYLSPKGGPISPTMLGAARTTGLDLRARVVQAKQRWSSAHVKIA